MKKSSIDALVKQLARKKASSYVGPAHDAGPRQRPRISAGAPADTAGFPEIRKGPAPDVVLDLHVCFGELSNAGQPSDTEKQKQAPATKRAIAPHIRKLLHSFTESELAEIRATQPAILSWIGDSDEKAELFFHDTLRAMEDAGIKLDPLLRRKIEQQRSRAANGRFEYPPDMPRARIRSTKVHACPKQEKA
jgi:hypothetical protein